jgi:hypothetical protein
MPFIWKQGRNPYRHSAFGVLRLGWFATPKQIVDQARELGKEIKSGRILKLGHADIDEHTLSDSSNRLRQPKSRAEELLLTHQPTRQDHRRRKKLVKELRKVTIPPEPPRNLQLRHPLALFWFTPRPGTEAITKPGWDELSIPGPTDPEDLIADIVFAG